jgi:BirA family transcriptional regulator, biotin operon repressor / biotin---[acetyl-CoA-carboxylase] ligase
MKELKVHWLNTVDSTNLEAYRNINNSSDITVWGADFQTAGRGQRGNKWESESGRNLTFSILFKPSNILAVKQFLISQITTLGILSYLKNKGINAKIKWPNDIYIEDKKICGILIENIISSDILSASIVGIGLNLNQKIFRSDAPNPTSLILEIEKIFSDVTDELSVKEEFSQLLKEIIIFYELLKTEEGREKIEELYHNSLYRLGQWHDFINTVSDEVFKGRILGINEKALLRIESSEGLEHCFAFKEIKYLI